ncbi:cytochrome P450 [Xylariaceae sp. FL0662B]|nr:cytochrome P450 [Xylariaceae sp. FL0662B]
MSSKRKATPGVQGANKAGKPSKASTPGLATPRGVNSDSHEPSEESEELNNVIARNVQKFDISSFPYTLPPGVIDEASRYFQPEQKRDFSALPLKPDHHNRPLWIDGWGKLILENFHPLAPQAQDFLITIAEPTSRPTFLHEYRLTTHSLYAAVSVGLKPKDIIYTLDLFSKNKMPSNVIEYITHCGKSYGKVKMVLKNTKYFLETTDPEILQTLLRDPVIGPCRVHDAEEITTTASAITGLAIAGTKDAAGVREAEALHKGKPIQDQTEQTLLAEKLYGVLGEEDDDDQDLIHAFQIKDEKVSTVAERCLTLHYPALEEYDFRNDHINANLEIDLRPGTQIRLYQEKSLSKMFGNGRAKSGIIVLPCGAGKTLVGVTAACTIKKGVIVLATNNMSVIQWRNEFLKWSNIDPRNIAIFSSESKSTFTGNTGIIITTYSMVTNTRQRAHDSAKMMGFLRSREWGLMLLDEVHVVPAQMFRNVIGSIKSHSKLGLTATLLREDDKIEDLNFLIGPKLYEANWMELSQQGHIAKVQCAEVWCPMPTEFFEQYIQASLRTRSLLYAMNPFKFQACQYLIKYHENRGDKIIVFSDNVYALEAYAKKLMKPFLYGGTSNAERQEILEWFRNLPQCSTIFLSKIGDTSLDLPEATCLIQISAQYGSRRQEAQRLGRILRAKRRNDEGFNAFFYSLVSKDTVEMRFSSKRQAFLVNQGYSFKVITQLKNMEDMPDLAFATPGDRRELLQKILAEAESKSWKEEEEKESIGLSADGNMFYGPDGKPLRKAVRRAAGSLKDLSGGQDTAYVEQNKIANKLMKGKNKGPYSSFFKAIASENKRRKKLATPFPRAAALIRGTLTFDVARFQKRYGPVVRIGPSELAFMTAEAWKDVYGHPGAGEENPKDIRFYRLVKSAPLSIISAGQEEHARLRRWLAYGFSDRSLQAQESIISGYIDLLVQRLHERCDNGNAPVNMKEWFNWTTFDIIGNLGFGSDFGCLEDAAYVPWIRMITVSMKKGAWDQALAYVGLTPVIRWAIERAQAGYESHRKLTRQKVEQRIELGKHSERPDFLQGLLGKGLTVQQLASNASTMIIAGSETTATLLSGAVFLLTTNRDALEKLIKEVRSTFKDEKEITLLSVQKLPYMLACLDESLRRYPPVANGMPRVAKAGGTTVAGCQVPEGTTIAVWQWAINHNTEYWTDPYSFKPERWTGEDPRFANDRLDTAQPFLVGHRGCIGRNLAYAEMRLILARVIYAFDVRLSDESKNWLDQQKNYILWEKPALDVYVTPVSRKS